MKRNQTDKKRTIKPKRKLEQAMAENNVEKLCINNFNLSGDVERMRYKRRKERK
jgi:hypothetical protein